MTHVLSDEARCRLLHTAGDVERHRGDRDAARGFYERASTIAEASDPFSEEAVTLLIKLGELENECGRSDAALQRLERALALAETTDPTSLPTAAALLAISRVHLNRHAPERAPAPLTTDPADHANPHAHARPGYDPAACGSSLISRKTAFPAR